MAAYQLTATDIVLRTADKASIPNDPGNRDRAEYERWLAAGNTPDPKPPVVVPSLNSVGHGPTSAELVGL